MPKTLIILIFIAIWIVLTILALTWGFVFDWPDYYHINYGVPLVWATHTLSTIAGPVDKWRVELFALVVDLLFWLVLMAIAVALMLYIFKRKSARLEKQFSKNSS